MLNSLVYQNDVAEARFHAIRMALSKSAHLQAFLLEHVEKIQWFKTCD